jgi:hypothetical protein
LKGDKGLKGKDINLPSKENINLIIDELMKLLFNTT